MRTWALDKSSLIIGRVIIRTLKEIGRFLFLEKYPLSIRRADKIKDTTIQMQLIQYISIYMIVSRKRIT